MKPRITIIVPVYKVEKYLEKCVESLINQTYKNIEIILVDDGSPDKCPQICDQYARKDQRIKVIHKENGGLSEARNVGLDEAKGEYILFVDSDDYIDIDTCEVFINILRGRCVDIVAGSAKRIEDNHMIYMERCIYSDENPITGQEFLKKELNNGKMHMAAWLNLYNRDFLIKNNLKFKVGLLHEDEEFTPRVFLIAKSILVTNYKFYNYLIRENSITTSSYMEKNSIHIINICKSLSEKYEEIEDKELRKLLKDDIVNKFLYAFQISRIYESKIDSKISNQYLVKNCKSIKTKIKLAIYIINKKLFYNIFKV